MYIQIYMLEYIVSKNPFPVSFYNLCEPIGQEIQDRPPSKDRL